MTCWMWIAIVYVAAGTTFTELFVAYMESEKGRKTGMLMRFCVFVLWFVIAILAIRRMRKGKIE